MELLPGDNSGGGVSKAGTWSETDGLEMSRVEIWGTMATSNGRVGAYVATGLTAVSL